MTFSYHRYMARRAVKKSISLTAELARQLQDQARAESKTLSGVIQEAIWEGRARLKQEFRELQNYWSEKARERGILSEQDLQRYLDK